MREALDALLREYARLIKRANELNNEINSQKLNADDLRKATIERDADIERVKRLEKEAALFGHT